MTSLVAAKELIYPIHLASDILADKHRPYDIASIEAVFTPLWLLSSI